MSNIKKTASELRAMAVELTEKAKSLSMKADQLDQQEELELLKAIKKAGKMEAVKRLLAEPQAASATVSTKTAVATVADHQAAQLETLMSASFDDIK